MPEGRMLKKLISTSQKLAKLKSDSARLLYTWLLPHLDIEGRFSADPYIVKGYVVPRLKMTPRKITEYLEDMVKNDLIILYEVNGDKFLQLKKFKNFQLLREDRESKSQIPSPVKTSTTTPGVIQENDSTIKLKENKLEESKSKEDEYILNLLSKVKDYPFNGKRDLEFIKGLIDEFPDLDALGEIKKKCAWWLSNPLLKKSNPHLQIRNWFIKAREFLKEGDKSRGVGKSYSKEPQFLSMELLNKIYQIIDSKGGDKGSFYDKAKSAFPIIRTQWEQSDKTPETFIRLVEEIR